MGCITSTNKLHELRQENVFRVRVAHLQPSGPGEPIVRSGYLELTPRELIFLTPNCEPIVWALQHLRRYGLNGDLFSFEAGRRCMSGQGIYTFRVYHAENLYPMFQRYINAVNTDAFAHVERERLNSTHSVLLARTDVTPHSNNYLEPAPILARAHIASNARSGERLRSAEPTEAAVETPETQIVNGEAPTLQSPITPGAYINTNVYFDQPLHVLQEAAAQAAQNGSPLATLPATTATTTTTISSGSCSAFSTMHRRSRLLKGCSLDMPPLESAPALNDTLHMYANVDTPSSCSLRERLLFDLNGSERCYENVNRLDLPLLLQPAIQRESSQQSVASTAQPATPTSLGGGGGVNYIVLDLDQPRSPAQSSPKAFCNGFGSGLSLTTGASFVSVQTAPVTPEGNHGAALEAPLGPQAHSLSCVSAEATATVNANSKPYSTIDFIRTYALNKTTTTPAHEAEELRLPRHGKCVRKSFSISE